MRRGLIIGLFSCVALMQIVTPLSMIVKRESVLKNGQQFKFKTAPVDPYDAFRGRYVALKIEEDKVSAPQGVSLRSDQRVYVHITVDEQGFAKFSTVTTGRPEGVPYIEARVQYIHKNNVHLELPLDRYYMEEKAAPVAEKIYREHAGRDNKQDAYVLVRLKDGFAVIEELYVGGKRIEEAVKSK